MNNEDLYHLIDLVQADTTKLLMNHNDKRILSDDEKLKEVEYNNDLVKKLIEELKDGK